MEEQNTSTIEDMGKSEFYPTPSSFFFNSVLFYISFTAISYKPDTNIPAASTNLCILEFAAMFSEKIKLVFHVNCLLSR